MTNLIINKGGTLYTLPDSVSCGTVNGVDIKEIEVNKGGVFTTVWKLNENKRIYIWGTPWTIATNHYVSIYCCLIDAETNYKYFANSNTKGNFGYNNTLNSLGAKVNNTTGTTADNLSLTSNCLRITTNIYLGPDRDAMVGLLDGNYIQDKNGVIRPFNSNGASLMYVEWGSGSKGVASTAEQNLANNRHSYSLGYFEIPKNANITDIVNCVRMH